MTQTMRHTLAMRGLGAVAAVVVALAVATPAQAWRTPHHHQAASSWQPGDVEPPLGSQENPLAVHNQPSQNDGGGSWAWADYGLHQILRAAKPSPAAKTLCQLDQPGESLWVSGGMMTPGQWVTVSAAGSAQQPSDVEILATDTDGTHGGSCAPVALVLRKVT
jgi:hypothetical protein